MMAGTRTAQRIVMAIFAFMCLAGVVMSLSGCRMSDVLREIVYDQSSETVDYDRPEKYYINDSSAARESELVPATEASDEAPATDERQNLVVYSSNPNSDEYTAKKSVFDKSPDFAGLEASEGVTLKRSDSEEAIDHEVPDNTTPDTEAQESQESDEQLAVPDDQAHRNQQGSSGADGSEGAGEAGEVGGESDGQADEGGTESPSTSDEGAGAGGEVQVIDSTSAFTEPPKAEKVAAFGEAAVIVQMVGGKGALGAADAETLAGGFGTVFADEGASDVAQGWSDGGSAAAIDADAIVGSGAKTVLVYATNYKDDIPAAALERLTGAGVTLTVIPQLANSTYIKQAVKTVGDILSDSNDIGNAGKTVKIASDYVAFHDEVVNACLAANGGSLASSGTVVYEHKNTSVYLFNNEAAYTLLLDGFDTSARFVKTIAGWKPVCNGAAMTTVGYGDSPVSFYLQAGGLINNAAALSRNGDTERIVAWQFNTNILSPVKENWEYSASGLMAKSANIDISLAEGWRRTVFNTGVKAASNGVGSSFGSARFPKAIVTEAAIRDKIVENSANEDGLYHPYALSEGEAGSVKIKAIGPLVDRSTVVYSSIGVEAQGKTTSWSGKSIPEDAFAVNPAGLVSSWVKGSVESVLEAAWANDMVAANSTQVGCESYVKRFYSEFFRYDLSKSELADIMDGE